MPSARSLDLVNGAEDLSQLLPTWLTPLYWFLIVLLSLLAAVINAGQDYVASLGSTAKSTVSLIALDSIMYFTLSLSALLLCLAATISKPWQSISPAFIAPMSAFIAACLYAHSVKIYESRILSLWLRISSMTVVNTMKLDPDALFTALQRATALPENPDANYEEEEILALVRADSHGGLAAAARNKGSVWPFLQVLKMWWQQGTAQSVPVIWIRRHVNGALRRCRAPRNVTHSTTVLRLQQCGLRLLQEQSQHTEQKVSMKVMTAFNHASRHVVHAKYGNIWMRASGQPGLEKSSDAWWFIGAEIVQSLKAAVGVEFLSGPGRYETVQDVKAMWEWVEELGFGFRQDLQTKPIAEELAKKSAQDMQICVDAAANMALGGPVQEGIEESVILVAREANIVACVGLAVKLLSCHRRGNIITSILELKCEGHSFGSKLILRCSRINYQPQKIRLW